jgi:hypothetical protein
MIDIEEASQSSETDESAGPYQVSGEVWMVPCTIDIKANAFVPMVKPSEGHSSERGQSRQMWTAREDEVLKAIIAAKGTKAWTSVAFDLNNGVHQGHTVRHGKQCRERWYNHLDPSLRKGNWTVNEDLLILEKQLELGNRWSEIAKIVKGRNENSVKNRWKSMIRKAQKELPPGTDVSRWLIAEKKDQEMEVVTDSSNIQLYSPLIYSSSPVFQMNPLGQQCQQPMASLPYHMNSIDLVKKSLRSMEQGPYSQQQLSWSPYTFKDPKDATMSPSTFLAF